ncbi:uncharacterized protein CIMG_06668 [Coccidioides immitis RS]|uniref:Mmc1 C-terminal domain-containing protein n=1 Tax=Coccidioides immitis RMSCC 3703 TaxID=454286 RepID=A0A0J8QQE0_COCIT|nr:uncharacterized protein CIMG_06668 [Coccidioides immitis RS]EAS31189.3 hypothetical protein CIMG_06668 [Coccidioides immitis RS]KMU74779.1 hypothetical protein CISG_00709 [Coccidioides immitis RMSCC 3703]
MPSKLRAGLLKGPLDLADFLLSCPACSPARQSLRSTVNSSPLRRKFPRFHRRLTSTVSASVASHENQFVPARYKELYESLGRVGEVAAEHVDLARLQLALRGLESERPVVRIAVLGVDDTATAVRLVRLILADPLSSKADWEKHLEEYHLRDSQGLLIRYGEPSETPVTDSSLPTISIPSITLRNASIEILISSISTRTSHLLPAAISNAIETPTISIGSSDGAHHTTVRYPVHKTIVCGNGIDDLLAYTKIAKNINGNADKPIVHATFNLNAKPAPKTGSQSLSFVDLEQAELALARFRESAQHATEYERGWTRSGIQPLIEWMVEQYQDSALRPEVRGLAQSVLDSTERNLARDENATLQKREAESVSENVRAALETEVSSWAESAHTELRQSLNDAFSNHKWRNLVWWKLFWRVDDVGMLSASILDKQWLPQAERKAIWLGGKFQQAGLLNQKQSFPIQTTDGATSNLKEGEALKALSTGKWPATISQTRDHLLNTKVPSLHALAQTLVLSSVSTTTLTSALSVLTYVATSATTLEEAGTIAAIGIIYSLRRQQKRWDAARRYWESEVREEGRKALKDSEDAIRTLLRDGGRATEPVIDTEARKGIDRAKVALESVK